MSDLHNSFIRDGVGKINLAGVNSDNELKVNDNELISVQNSAFTKLEDIETAIENVNDSIDDSKIESGGQDKQWTYDQDSHELLNEILKQIKITNLHLAQLSDLWIDKEEVNA